MAKHRRNLTVASDATLGNLPHQLVRTLEEAFPLHRTPLRPLPVARVRPSSPSTVTARQILGYLVFLANWANTVE